MIDNDQPQRTRNCHGYDVEISKKSPTRYSGKIYIEAPMVLSGEPVARVSAGIYTVHLNADECRYLAEALIGASHKLEEYGDDNTIS